MGEEGAFWSRRRYFGGGEVIFVKSTRLTINYQNPLSGDVLGLLLYLWRACFQPGAHHSRISLRQVRGTDQSSSLVHNWTGSHSGCETVCTCRQLDKASFITEHTPAQEQGSGNIVCNLQTNQAIINCLVGLLCFKLLPYQRLN